MEVCVSLNVLMGAWDEAWHLFSRHTILSLIFRTTRHLSFITFTWLHIVTVNPASIAWFSLPLILEELEFILRLSSSTKCSWLGTRKAALVTTGGLDKKSEPPQGVIQTSSASPKEAKTILGCRVIHRLTKPNERELWNRGRDPWQRCCHELRELMSIPGYIICVWLRWQMTCWLLINTYQYLPIEVQIWSSGFRKIKRIVWHHE